jgi:hypothetical protein
MDINQKIDECINQLSDDRVDSGVECLHELAILWKTAGSTHQSFVDLCTYIEREAGEKSDEVFVKYKINAALKKAKENKRKIIVGV